MPAQSEGQPLNSYRVKLGHLEVSVRCGCAEEAVRIARQQLGDELPRLYDVIHQLDKERFRVTAEKREDV